MDKEKVGMEKIFAQLEIMAKNFGLESVDWNENRFIAEDRRSSVYIRIDEVYGKIRTEISWASAGMPSPTDDDIQRHIDRVIGAQKLKLLFDNSKEMK